METEFDYSQYDESTQKWLKNKENKIRANVERLSCCNLQLKIYLDQISFSDKTKRKEIYSLFGRNNWNEEQKEKCRTLLKSLGFYDDVIEFLVNTDLFQDLINSQ